MDAGGLAQMNSTIANPLGGLGQVPASGLASRRGGQNLKPLSLAAPPAGQDNEVPTPRTSRSHLLAGLRTAPKTAAASTFSNAPSSMVSPTQQTFGNRNGVAGNGYSQGQNIYNPPKTAVPQFAQQQQQSQPQQAQQQQAQQQQAQQQQAQQQQAQQQQAQQQQAQQQQAQQQQAQQQQAQQGYSQGHNTNQQYTMEQILAPPEIRVEDQEQMDPQVYAQLVATNMYLAQQQRALQQELYNIQAAAQQFQGLNLGPAQQQIQQQQLAMYQQQQQVQSMQHTMLGMMAQQQQAQQQQNVYAYVDPATGQTKYYMDPAAAQTNAQYIEQSLLDQLYGGQQQQTQQNNTPRVQVSPPAEGSASPFRTNSPAKRNESPVDVTPLPPPSANAFRRGHKKIASLAMPNPKQSLCLSTDAPQSAGPRSASFPPTPSTGSYGPGQGRAGEHPVRQPRGPPSIEELKSKPSTKHDGSKNFCTRTRRSAVHNLVRAGKERRKGPGSASGSMSPVSESAEETGTPITDNESDSGRSGSGSLSGDMDCSLPSSRTSTNGSWGAIGSERPGSRQKTRKSLESLSSATSACESEKENSFASVFKNSAQKAGVEVSDGQRKAPMLVLTNVEKRKTGLLNLD